MVFSKNVDLCWETRDATFQKPLEIQGRTGSSWLKEVTKIFPLTSILQSILPTPEHSIKNWTIIDGEAVSPMPLYLHTRAQCKKYGSVGWRGNLVSKDLPLQIKEQTSETTLNNNKRWVWWDALATPTLERWRYMDQWKQLCLAKSKPVRDPASKKTDRILTVFEVGLWHSDTCANTKRKEKTQIKVHFCLNIA